jgi:hypothetical protein
MAEDFEIDQEDPIPLPKGFKAINNSGDLPLPKGFALLKKKEVFETNPNSYLNSFGQKLGPSGNISSPTISQSQEETNNLPSTSNLGYKATDARVGGEAINGEKIASPKVLGKALVLGAGSGVSGILKSIGIASKDIDLFGEYKGKKAEELATYKAGKWVDEQMKDLFGELSPEEQKNYSVRLFNNVGQIGTMALGGAGSKVLGLSEGLTSAFMGAALQGSAEYENAVNIGATPDQSSKVFWANTAIGSAMAIPVVGAFRKLDKYTGGLATGALAKQIASTAEGRLTSDMLQGAIVNAATMAGQNILTNVVAKNTYDTTRGVFDGLKETMATGGIIGATMHGITSGIREKRAAGNLTPEENADLDKAEAFANEKINEVEKADKKAENIVNHATKVKENLQDKGLSEDAQDNYVAHSLVEKLANEKAEKLTDPTLIKEQKEIAKDAVERKEQLLKGKKPEEIVTEKEQKEIDEKEKNQINLQRLHEDNKLDIEKLDAEKESIAQQRKGLDGRKPEDRDAIAKLEIKSKEHEVKRKRINEDYQKAVEKLSPKEEVVETEETDPIKQASEAAWVDIQDPNIAKLFAENPEQGLKEAAQQLNASKGEAEIARKVYGDTISDIALKLYPEEKVTLPEEVTPNKKVRVSAEQLEERQPEKIRQRYIDDFNTVENSKFDWRVTSSLSSADRVKAVSDIKAGKNTAAARKLNAETDEMIKRGTVIINRGRGSQAESVEIPIDEWFKFTPIEHDKAIKAAESVDENIISIIKDNDITLQNIDSLKELFNGFPYDDTDFTAVKNHLQGETTRNAETPRVSEQGEATTPTTEKIESEVGKPPTEPPIEEVPAGGGKEGIGITHADTAEMREENKLPPYEKETQTVEAWRAEATNRIKNGELPALLDKMKRGETITDVEQMMMGQHIANLDAELTKAPSKENLSKLNEAIELSDKAGGSAWGRSGRARQESFLPDDSLGTFLKDKEAAQGTPLSEEQVKKESAKYEELKKAKEDLEQQLQKEREQHAKDIAELGLNKARAKAKKEAKKSHEEYTAERKASVEAAKEALKKIRQDQSLKATVPGFAELKAIAPHVKDFLQSLANEGVDKIDVAVSKIHAEFKDILDGITTTDIFNIIGAEYDTKKEQTRNQKAANLRLIQREAALIKELARERKGEEKTKSEKQKTASNRRIDELKQKIKDVRQQRKEEAEPVEDMSVGESERLHSEIDKLTKKAQSLANDIKNKKYLEEKPQPKAFARSAKYKALQDRVIDLENKIRHERSKDEYEKRSKVRKAFDKVMEVLGIRRLVQSAVDISVPFRQGATLISPRRIDIWAKGFKANIQSIFSPKRFERIMYEIRHDKDYHDAVKDGIVYNDLGSADPNLHNEDFRKSFIYDIPIVSEPLKASNRSADAFLNIARYEMYKKMRRVLEMKGLTRESDPKAFKFIGNWVMSMTGRGRMTNMLENSVAHTVLGNTFYGARLMASRFNLLNPVTYFDPRVPREAKVEAMKDMAAFVVTTMAAGAGLAAAGGKVSLNPDDSDFLQVRFGDKVYDISGGLANYVRTFLRIVKAGYTKATETKYEGKQATDKAGESVLNFFRNKLSPNTGYAVDAFFGGRYGQGFNPADIAKIYPMYADDAVKALKEDGAVSLATVLLPNLLGIGYGSYASKGQIDKNLEDLKKRNMRSDEMNNEKIYNYNDGGRQITDKEFDEFADKRDEKVEKGIEKLFKEGALVLDENNEPVQKPYNELTPEQVAKETGEIKAKATTKAKEELFGKKKETIKEKEGEAKLEGAKKLKEFNERNQ